MCNLINSLTFAMRLTALSGYNPMFVLHSFMHTYSHDVNIIINCFRSEIIHIKDAYRCQSVK